VSLAQRRLRVEGSVPDCMRFPYQSRRLGLNTQQKLIKQGFYVCSSRLCSITRNWLEWDEIVGVWQPLATGAKPSTRQQPTRRRPAGHPATVVSTPAARTHRKPGSKMLSVLLWQGCRGTPSGFYSALRKLSGLTSSSHFWLLSRLRLSQAGASRSKPSASVRWPLLLLIRRAMT